MSKIVVLGAGGMLGREIVRFAREDGYEVFAADRTNTGILNQNVLRSILRWHSPDVLVNCIGIVPQKLGERYSNTDMVHVNAFLPHMIKDVCAEFGVRMVQISTDCVFSGAKGDYSVTDIPDPVDLYGRTKVVGEVGDLIVRTSFIGFEHGLLSWLVSNRGGSVDGYSEAWWSGSTVYEVARKMVPLLDASLVGTIHLATIDAVSKNQVLRVLNEELDLGITIKSVDVPKIDRSLKPTFLILPIWSVVQELKDGYLSRHSSWA